MAFIYATHADACEALETADVPNGTLVTRNHDDDTWGWADPEVATTPEVDPADVVAKAGDVILQVSGPFLTTAALLQAEVWAKKLGVTIIVRDAVTFAEVKRVVKSAKGSGGKSGSAIERDERGLTEKQAIILDLMLRPDGATNAELMADGATDAKSVAWVYQQACITRATKGQFARARGVIRENDDGSEVKAFRMVEVPESDRARVLYDTEVAMVAKKQLKAVIAPEPKAVIAPEPKAEYLQAAE